MATGTKTAKIVVIGSGFAGLAAASTLSEAGFQNLLILEAKDRVGGRVHTIKPFTENIIEVGANWIHGQVGNPLFKLAKEQNLLSEGPSASKIMCLPHSVTPRDYFFHQDGKQVSTVVVDQVCALFSKLTSKAFDDALEHRHRNLSLGGYLDDAFSQSLLAKTEEAWRVFEWCKRTECTDEACSSLYEVSASQISYYTALDGGFFNTLGPGGYQAILDVLLKKLPGGAIHCSTSVRRICWDLVKEGEQEARRSPVQIVCEDGRSFEADHVIVTVSLGVLKDRAKVMFQPSLPKTKLDAIDSLGFGVVDKIFLYFEERFWPEDCAGVQLVWDQGPEDKALHQSVSAGDSWKERWFRKITGFDTVARHPTALCGWITGREAQYMETLPEGDVGAVCVRLLRSFTGWSVPDVSKTLISKWGCDPDVHGSYTFIPDGVDGVKAHKALAAPLPPKAKSRGRKHLQVLFAGEATHVNFYTTTHGAFLSGVREAERLVSFYSA